VPLVLVPLALVLLWTALWRIWLPPATGSGGAARTVTTVDANAPTRPTHRVTTVVRTTRAAVPPRRSEVLALALLFLASGAAIVGVFHDRIGSIQLGKDGIKIDLSAAEGTGAAALVSALASRGASPQAYASAVQRYLGTLSRRRGAAGAALGAAPPLTSEEATALATRIADQTG
jgi:hypothetical protein